MFVLQCRNIPPGISFSDINPWVRIESRWWLNYSPIKLGAYVLEPMWMNMVSKTCRAFCIGWQNVTIYFVAKDCRYALWSLVGIRLLVLEHGAKEEGSSSTSGADYPRTTTPGWWKLLWSSSYLCQLQWHLRTCHRSFRTVCRTKKRLLQYEYIRGRGW